MHTATVILKSHSKKYVKGLSPISRGKTRDIYPTRSKDHLLIVASDRVSTHNVVHDSLIPDKGIVLTAFTIFWTLQLRRLLPNEYFQDHLEAFGGMIEQYLISDGVEYSSDIQRRAIVVKKLEMIPYEFIYRRFLAGSLYSDYCQDKNPYGVDLESGLEKMSRFDYPIFTPTDKSSQDNPVSSEWLATEFPDPVGLGYQIFCVIEAILNCSGLELVDSKLEFGIDPKTGKLNIADEIVTPDNSRFCYSDDVEIGCDPKWADKQIARDYAKKFWEEKGVSKREPVTFPVSVVRKIQLAYSDLFYRVADITPKVFWESWE